MERSIRPRRSLIFAPGNRPDMFPKALNSGADVVAIDLEDAIAPQHKDEARRKTLAFFAECQPRDDVECMVRVNCLRSRDGLADLQAIVESDSPPPALMLPKIKSPDEIRVHEELLSGRHSGVRFHVIVETTEGLESCLDIARSSERIDSLLFGGVDMAAELRVAPEWDALFYARARLVHAAATVGLDLIDVPYLDLDDMQGMETEARACAVLGMTGKGAIHPKQIPFLNQCFSPALEEIQRARQVIEAFEASGGGLVVIDNKLIEKPVLRSMYRTLAIAERMK